jgi:hypothetical protein
MALKKNNLMSPGPDPENQSTKFLPRKVPLSPSKFKMGK